MNGRLYDPLLRRFLNADENIQDMFNTQNYNKYGYVMNNPLMFNDPSGEFLWFLPLAWLAEFIVVHSTAIIIGAAIGAAMYLGQAAITGNFSWGGFAKSIFVGGLTGAVSGALGQVFSASGFWATVGNGALAGAGSGGVTSLINGTNFFEGIIKGAVIGGTIGAVSYGLGKIFQGKKVLDYQSTNVGADDAISSSANSTVKYDAEYTSNWINQNYRGYELQEYGYRGFSFKPPHGFDINSKGQFQIKSGFHSADGKLAYAITDPSTNIIHLSPSAYQSNGRFALSFSHELSHVAINNNLNYFRISEELIKTTSSSLNNIGHFAIRYNEQLSAHLNGFSLSATSSKTLINSIKSSWNFFQQKVPSVFNKINDVIKFTKPIQVRPFIF